MKKLTPLGLLFVDLMASTFAIIFLVLFITLLKTSQDTIEPTIIKPTKHKSSEYRIKSGVLGWLDGDGTSHPSIKKINIKKNYSGYIELHEEYISYYKKYSDIPIKIEKNQLQKKDLSLGNFLSKLNKEKKVLIYLYSPKYVYKIQKLITTNNLSWFLDYSYKDDDKKQKKEEYKKEKSHIQSYLKQPSQQAHQETFNKLERNAQKKIEQNLQSTYEDTLWEYLTQKIYRDKGYDLWYYQDKDKIFFSQEDVEKYLRPIYYIPTQKEPSYWWVLLMLLGMSYYLYKEFTLSAKENYL